jgi:peptidoglycan/LPS O-acetylase OafA/YrhL
MYLLFPFILILFKKFKKTYQTTALSLSIFVFHSCFIYFLNWSNYGGMSLGGMVRVFFEFSLGVTLFLLRNNIKLIFIHSGRYVCEILVLLSISAVLFKRIWFLFVPTICLVITHLSVLESGTSKFLSKKIMIYFGNISFSLYMWHWLIIQINNWFLYKHIIVINSIKDEYLSSLVIISISIYVAHYSYFYIEKPVRKWLRN